MAFDRALLDILCCPVTHAPLALMQVGSLERLNALIGERRVKNRVGQLVTEPVDDALVTRDGAIAYPVRDGIPVLLEDDGIPLTQIDTPPETRD